MQQSVQLLVHKKTYVFETIVVSCVPVFLLKSLALKTIYMKSRKAHTGEVSGTLLSAMKTDSNNSVHDEISLKSQ